MQSPHKGSEMLRGERDEILLILDLEEGEWMDSGNEEEGKRFHRLQVLGMNSDLWDRVRGLGNEA